MEVEDQVEDTVENAPIDLLAPEVSLEEDPLTISSKPSEETLDNETSSGQPENDGILDENTNENNVIISSETNGLDNNTTDTNQENENPNQKPEEFTEEETAVYQELFGPGKQAVEFLRIHCTACNEHLGSAPNMQYKRYIHPLLKVLQCKKCFDFYGSGEFDKDEDGSELYCRWCGQGGKVLCCAHCCYVFCQRCIRANLGKKALARIKESDDWTCFACKPEQVTKSRVICKALYKYTQDEIRHAAELEQPGRLNVDHSLCCKDKLKTILTEKRKRSNSLEFLYNGDSDDETHKKKKKMKTNILSHMSAAITNKNSQKKSYLAPESPNIWESQIQDEVVCTPDLSMLMEEDDSSAQTSTETPPLPVQPISPIPSCSTVLPSLVPLSSKTNSKSNKDSEVQFVGQSRVTSAVPARKTVVVATSNLVNPNPLGYKLPLFLNTTNAKPIPSNNVQKNVTPNFVHLQAPAVKFSDTNEVQPIVRVAHNRNSSVINATPAKLAPGLRYEWFEKATQVTARVNQNLSARLCSLSKEQYSVTSLEGLASIHNNLQEILSNSINSLMQIRKSLRSDFIAGLKKLKFCKPQTIPDDNDVVVVDSTKSSTNTVQTPSINTSGNKPTGYIKVKPVSELFDSSVITIPDDNATSNNSNRSFPSINNYILPKNHTLTPIKRNDNTILNGLLSSPNAKENSRVLVATKQVIKPVNHPNNTERPTIGTFNIIIPETRQLIKEAVIESKFEALVNQNMKYNVPKVSPRELKRMLSVRVLVETNFGEATPRTKPCEGYKPMNIRALDLEELLSSSDAINISKEKGNKASEKDDDIHLLSDDDDDDKEVEIISEDRIAEEVSQTTSTSVQPEVIDLENSDVAQEISEITQQEPSKEVDQQEPSKEVDQQEPSKEVDQQEPSKEADQQETSKEVDQQEPSKEADQQETSMEVDQQEPPKEADQQETSMEVDQQEPSKEADPPEPSKETDRQETSMEVDHQETSEVTQQEESSEDTTHQETSEKVASPQQTNSEEVAQQEISQQQNSENQDTSKEINNEPHEDNEEILNEISRPIDENDETLNEITNQLLGENEPILKDNQPRSENVEACQNPCTTDSGIDVDGEQSLSNGLMNCQENE